MRRTAAVRWRHPHAGAEHVRGRKVAQGAARACTPPDLARRGSTFRQVPDHQEVWVDDTRADCALIVELLAAEPLQGVSLAT